MIIKKYPISMPKRLPPRADIKEYPIDLRLMELIYLPVSLKLSRVKTKLPLFILVKAVKIIDI